MVGECIHLSLVTDICCKEREAVTWHVKAVGGLFQLFAVHIGQDYLGALFEQGLYYSLADPAGRPGHDDRPPGPLVRCDCAGRRPFFVRGHLLPPLATTRRRFFSTVAWPWRGTEGRRG